MNKKPRQNKKDVYSPYCNEYYSKRSFYDELINKYRSLIAEVSVLNDIITRDIELSKNWDQHIKSEQMHPQFNYPNLSTSKETLQDVIDRIKEVKSFIEIKVEEIKKVKSRLESIKFSTDADNKDYKEGMEQNLQHPELPYIDLDNEWDFQGTLDSAEASIAFTEALNDKDITFESEISYDEFEDMDQDFSKDRLQERFGIDAYRIDYTYDGYHSAPNADIPSFGSDMKKKDDSSYT